MRMVLNRKVGHQRFTELTAPKTTMELGLVDKRHELTKENASQFSEVV